MFHKCFTSVYLAFHQCFIRIANVYHQFFLTKCSIPCRKTLTISHPLAPVVRLVIFIFSNKLYTPTLPPFLPPTKGNHIVLYPMFGNTIHIPPFIPKTFGQFMSYLVSHRYILILILKVLLGLIRPISGIAYSL